MTDYYKENLLLKAKKRDIKEQTAGRQSIINDQVAEWYRNNREFEMGLHIPGKDHNCLFAYLLHQQEILSREQKFLSINIDHIAATDKSHYDHLFGYIKDYGEELRKTTSLSKWSFGFSLVAAIACVSQLVAHFI